MTRLVQTDDFNVIPEDRLLKHEFLLLWEPSRWLRSQNTIHKRRGNATLGLMLPQKGNTLFSRGFALPAIPHGYPTPFSYNWRETK